MARFPGAEWRPLPENETQSRIVPTQFIVHTAVDHPGPSNIPGYFGRADVTVESHFWIPNDGKTVQMIDTNVRADANLHGNVRAISVETEDDGDPEANPWTDAQIEALIELMTWVRQTHGIPMEVMPAWDQPGVGWHSMWGFDDPVNLTGMLPSSPWTPSRGKTCPGKTRIGQFLEEVMPMFDEIDSRDARIEELEAAVDKHKATQRALRATAQRLRADLQRVRERNVNLQTRVAEAEAVPPPVPGVPFEQYQQAVDQVEQLRQAMRTAADNLAAAAGA